MATLLDKFKHALKKMFMLDQAELDFGIYRIMNQKKGEIEQYLDTTLPKQVKELLAANVSTHTTELQKQLDEAIRNAQSLGVPADNLPKVIALREEIAKSGNSDEMENSVYSHLTTFFSRYYEDGDFISLRRYKKDVYAIPYEGEEVKLHWANADQYYIKTGEYFRNYSFALGDGKRVEFTLKDVSTEHNNNLAQNNMERRFALYESEPITVEGNTLHINFTYELYPKATKQKALTDKAYSAVKECLPMEFRDLLSLRPTESDRNRTLLQKHLTDYVARNTFDYFIHKDLQGFLSRELDFYIKNEILVIDDINARSTEEFVAHLTVIKAVKAVGMSVIQFLAQLENYQKRLWLKKKMVVQADYCITLDRVPEELYAEICANDRQREEWVRLFAIDEIKGEGMFKAGYSVPLTEKFLEENPFLVLDTAFFTDKFKQRLISSIDNLDEQCDGLLIDSDNFHALELLTNKYQEKIDGVYIDPPYNTGSDGFVYKDNYMHSSWLSMINDRLQINKTLMNEESSISISINENELFSLKQLLDIVFDNNYFTTLTVKVRHEDRILKGDKDFHEVYENVLFYSKTNKFKPLKRLKDNTSIDDYKYVIETKVPNFSLTLGEKEVEVYSPENYLIRKMEVPSAEYLKPISIRGSIREGNSSGRFYVSYLEPIAKNYPGYLFKVPNMGDDKYGYRFFWTPSIESNRKNGDYYQGKPLNGKDYIEIPFPNYIDFEPSFNDATNEGGIPYRNGKKPVDFLQHLLTLQKITSNKLSIIIDYFAGSASTGHALVNLNRKDKGNRKYILVQVGHIFEEVTKPRMEKVIYSEDWNNGKPVNRKGSSHCFKYMRLEQYEDTLNNLVVSQNVLDAQGEFYDGFLLGYMLDLETRDSLFNLKWFENPFDMKLRITRNNEMKEEKVDLVETFNYLIGLYVEQISYPKVGICTVVGRTRQGKKSLVIWRDCTKVNNDQLNDFFRRSAYSVRDNEFDTIYVNGDNNLDNLRTNEDTWKVVLIEQEFNKQMFNS